MEYSDASKHAERFADTVTTSQHYSTIGICRPCDIICLCRRIDRGFNSAGTCRLGWINSHGNDQAILQPQFPRFSNYIVGLSQYTSAPNVTEPLEYRNFFVFKIPEGIAFVSSATLHIPNPNDGYNSRDSSEMVSFVDVVSSIDQIMEGGSGLLPYFNDLGEGPLYGAVNVNSTDVDKYIDIPLNAAALTSIQSARGDLWATGGKITTIFGGPFQTVFGNTPIRSLPYLTIEAELVPEANSLLLLSFVGCAAVVVRRVRK